MAAWTRNAYELGLHWETVEMLGGERAAKNASAGLYGFIYGHILRGRANRREYDQMMQRNYVYREGHL